MHGTNQIHNSPLGTGRSWVPRVLRLSRSLLPYNAIYSDINHHLPPISLWHSNDTRPCSHQIAPVSYVRFWTYNVFLDQVKLYITAYRNVSWISVVHINIIYAGRSRNCLEILMRSTFVHYFLIQVLKYTVNIYSNQSLDIIFWIV